MESLNAKSQGILILVGGQREQFLTGHPYPFWSKAPTHGAVEFIPSYERKDLLRVEPLVQNGWLYVKRKIPPAGKETKKTGRRRGHKGESERSEARAKLKSERKTSIFRTAPGILSYVWCGYWIIKGGYSDREREERAHKEDRNDLRRPQTSTTNITSSFCIWFTRRKKTQRVSSLYLQGLCSQPGGE